MKSLSKWYASVIDTSKGRMVVSISDKIEVLEVEVAKHFNMLCATDTKSTYEVHIVELDITSLNSLTVVKTINTCQCGKKVTV